MSDIVRCAWAIGPELIAYHDHEWGVPEHDESMLFELLTLEGAQAGLSWATVLKKRSGYRAAFVSFDIATVAAFDDARITLCLADAGIIRNRAKVRSTVNNAQAIVALQQEHGSFDAFLWSFTVGRQIVSRRRDDEQLPAWTELSVTISKELKRRNFSFIGPTIVYSFLQAIGIVDDHYTACFRAQ